MDQLGFQFTSHLLVQLWSEIIYDLFYECIKQNYSPCIYISGNLRELSVKSIYDIEIYSKSLIFETVSIPNWVEWKRLKNVIVWQNNSINGYTSSSLYKSAWHRRPPGQIFECEVDYERNASVFCHYEIITFIVYITYNMLYIYFFIFFYFQKNYNWKLGSISRLKLSIWMTGPDFMMKSFTAATAPAEVMSLHGWLDLLYGQAQGRHS